MALSDFQKIRKLGAGGQGEVFEVLHRPSGRHLALKLALTPESPDPASPHDIPRWSPHSRILDSLADGWTEEGLRWQAFQLLDPVVGRAAVKEAGPPAALSLLSQAGAAVAHVHSQGWLITDLKPDNLIIEATGNENPWHAWRLYLADLDLARPISSRSTGLDGTQGYLAPELLSGSLQQSKSSDIFALGAWLLWLISGREPFLGELNATRMLDLIHLELATPPARSDVRFNGAIWGHVLSRMLDPDPQNRLQDGVQLLSFLANHASNDRSWSIAMPRLIWNRRSLCSTDATFIGEVRRILNEETDTGVLVLRYNRSSFIDELMDMLFVNSDLGAPVVIHPASHAVDVLDRIANGSNGIIVIDVSRSRGSDELQTAAQTLELATLSRQALLERRPPVILLANIVQDLSSMRLQDLGTTVLEHAVARAEPAELASWANELFSSIPISISLLGSLARRGAFDPTGVDQLLQTADQRDALRLTSGYVALVEEEADLILNEALDLETSSRITVPAQAVRHVAAAVPGGIPLHLLDLDGIGSSIKELERLESMGLVKLARTRGAVSLVQMDGPTSRLRDTDCVEQVRAIAATALARNYGEKAMGAVAKAALQFLNSNVNSRGYSRGRALARAMLRGGDSNGSEKLLELRRVLRSSSSPSASEVLDFLMEARAALRSGELETAREILSHALEAVDGDEAKWLALRVRIAWAILEFEHGNRQLAGKLVQESEGLLTSAADGISRQLRAAVSLLVLRLRITDLGDPSLDIHFDRIMGDPGINARLKAVALAKWGRRLFAKGDPGGARGCFARALCLARSLRDVETLGAVITPVMAYHFSRGYLARTGRLLNRVSKLPQSVLSAADRTAWMSGMGALAYEQGQIRRAYDVNVHLYEHAKQLGHDVLGSSATLNIGLLLQLMNHPAASRRYLQESEKLSRAAKTRTWEMALIHLGDVELELGRNRAVEEIVEALDSGGPRESIDLIKAHIQRLRGRLCIATGDAGSGRKRLVEACEWFSILNAQDEVIVTELDLVACSLNELPAEQLALAVQELKSKAVSLGNWRISALTVLLGIRCGVDPEESSIDRRLRDLIGEALDRGFVTLELAALEILCERQLSQGWIAEARDSLRSAMDRVRSASSEFVDLEIRNAYLASPARQRLRSLALQLK